MRSVARKSPQKPPSVRASASERRCLCSEFNAPYPVVRSSDFARV
jgi:hypothetical protein